ncbi:MAG: DUF4760 domain-containing protein [Pseudomonadota bacterium]
MTELDFIEILSSYGTVFLVVGSFSGVLCSIVTTITLRRMDQSVAARSKSIDIVRSWSQDEYVNDVFDRMRDMLHGKERPYCDATNSLSSTASDVLNYYEAISIGISEGALNERIMKKWWRTSFVRHYIFLKETVDKHRCFHDMPSLFYEFERLALKWRIESDRVPEFPKAPTLIVPNKKS